MNRLGANAPLRLLVCLSHLPWDLVFQRPQHLLTRAARDYAVLYVEEPREADVGMPLLASRRDPSGVEIATPLLPPATADPAGAVRRLLDERLQDIASGRTRRLVLHADGARLRRPSRARPLHLRLHGRARGLQGRAAGLIEREDRLFAAADLVFMGGHSLYEAKRRPASRARSPSRAASTPSTSGRRAGACRIRPTRRRSRGRGSASSASSTSAWTSRWSREGRRGLPRDPVRHARSGGEDRPGRASRAARTSTGSAPRTTHELPAYLGGWDAGWMPFALNAATRFISPTKTPEFLAAGLPLVSTAVPTWCAATARAGMVAIADEGDVAEKLRASLVHPRPGLGGAGEGAPRWHLLGPHLVGDGRAHPPAA